jgi:hypothetical protein
MQNYPSDDSATITMSLPPPHFHRIELEFEAGSSCCYVSSSAVPIALLTPLASQPMHLSWLSSLSALVQHSHVKCNSGFGLSCIRMQHLLCHDDERDSLRCFHSPCITYSVLASPELAGPIDAPHRYRLEFGLIRTTIDAYG